jgi:hypothetical protein
MSKSILSPGATYLELNKPGNFQMFFLGLIELLKKKLQRIDVGGSGHYYYICGKRYMTGVIIIGILLVTCGRIPNENNLIFMW